MYKHKQTNTYTTQTDKKRNKSPPTKSQAISSKKKRSFAAKHSSSSSRATTYTYLPVCANISNVTFVRRSFRYYYSCHTYVRTMMMVYDIII